MRRCGCVPGFLTNPARTWLWVKCPRAAPPRRATAATRPRTQGTSAVAFKTIEDFGFVLPKCPTTINCAVQLLLSSEVRRRASSKARTANLRRDSARRSYRSIASSCLVSCDKIVANLYGPCGVELTICSTVASGRSGAFFCRIKRRRAAFSACLLGIHNEGRPRCGTAIDGGHFARGANRSLPRRLGAPALGFARSRPGRRSPAQAFPPPLTMLDWNKREG